MGVFRLSAALKNARFPAVDIVPPPGTRRVIFVDQYSWVFTFLDHCVGEYPLLGGPSRQVELSDYTGIRGVTYAWLLVLRYYGIEFEFFIDGAYALGTDEGDASLMKWKQRRSDRDKKTWEGNMKWRNSTSFAAALEAFQMLSLPAQSNTLVRDLFLSLNVPYRVCPSGADVQMCHMMLERNELLSHLPPVYGILTSDTDFAISKGVRMIVAWDFDRCGTLMNTAVKEVLCAFPELRTDPTAILHYERFEAWAKANLTAPDLRCQVWDSEKAAKALGIYEQELPSFAVLCGNDETKTLYDTHSFAGLPRPLDPRGVSKWIQQHREATFDYRFRCVADPTCRQYMHEKKLWKAMERADALYCYESADWARDGTDEYLAWRARAKTWYDVSRSNESVPHGQDALSLPSPVTAIVSLDKADDWLRELQSRSAIPKDCIQLALRVQCFLQASMAFDPDAARNVVIDCAVIHLHSVNQAVLGIVEPVTYNMASGARLSSVQVQAPADMIRTLSLVPCMKQIVQTQQIPWGWKKALLRSQADTVDGIELTASPLVTYLQILWGVKHHDGGSEYLFTSDEIESLIVSLVLNRGKLPVVRASKVSPGYDLEADFREIIPFVPDVRVDDEDARHGHFCMGWRTMAVYDLMQTVFHLTYKPLGLVKGLCGAYHTFNAGLVFNPFFRLTHSAWIYGLRGQKTGAVLGHDPEDLALPFIDESDCGTKLLLSQTAQLRARILSHVKVQQLLRLMPGRT